MKISLIGYGKMGKEIEKIAISRGHEIVYKIDIDNQSDMDKIKPSNTDVAIEFTTPHTAFANVQKILSNGVSLVCGSTGWNEKLEEARNLCLTKNTSFLWASNYSIGVNLFFKLNKHLAKLMNPVDVYEPRIKEIHHTQKLDAPSGTAITLAEGLLENYKAKKDWKLAPEGGKDSVIITAEREGQVPGTHVITYESEVDFIEITHVAKGRQGLALGAVVAAEYIKGKKGNFTMDDVLAL